MSEPPSAVSVPSQAISPAQPLSSVDRRRQHPAHLSPLRSVNRPTIIYLTVCVAQRRPLLATSAAHALFVSVWSQADRWRVGRYGVMPDHVHLFCAPGDQVTPLKRWIEFWRNAFTRAWAVDADKPIWQRDFWDRQLRHGQSYAEKWEYVRRNPVRAELVASPDDWPYQGEMNVLRW
jgi:putative transposase